MGVILKPRVPRRARRTRCKTRKSLASRQGGLGVTAANSLLNPRVPDGVLGDAVAEQLQPSKSGNSCKRKNRNRKRHRRHNRRRRVFGDRFREQVLPQPVTFIGTYTNKPVVGSSTTQSFSTAVNSDPLQVKRCWDQVHPGPPYVTGGPVTLLRGVYPLYQVKGDVDWWVYRNVAKTSYYRYKGGFAPLSFPWSGPTAAQINTLGLALPYDPTWFDASPYGAQGYQSSLPHLAGVQGAVAIGELRDLPGMLGTTIHGLKNLAKGFSDLYHGLGGNMATGLMSPKSVSDHFLNHVFGWSPFVSDVGKAYQTYRDQNKVMNQIEHDNGKWKVRKRRLVNQKDKVFVNRTYSPWVIPYSNISHMLTTNTIDGNVCRGYCDAWRTTEEYVWFEGVFKFYLSSFDRSLPGYYSKYNQLQRMMQIYGLRISPATIYKLTPWTWLADWFTKLGKQIDYLTSVFYDGTASKYAYVMRTKVEKVTQTHVIFSPPGYPLQSFDWTYGVLTKVRRAASSPFGFDLSWDDLNSRQLAILGALGITRARV